MAKNGSPLGFATVGNTTVSSFFAFITGATTVSGLFLGIFGLTAFSTILVHDNNVTIWTVLSGLQLLPNPLDFIRDLTQIVNAFGNLIKQLKLLGASTGSQIIDFLVNIASSLITIVSYVVMFVVGMFLLPAYIVFFFLRCFAVVLTSLGFGWDILNVLKLDWSPIENIIRFIQILGGKL